MDITSTKEFVLKKIVFISSNFFPPFYSGKLIISGKRLQDLDPAHFEVVVLTSGLPQTKRIMKEGNVKTYRSPFLGCGKISGRLNVVVFWIWSWVKLALEKNVSVIHFDEIGYFSIPIFHGLGYRLAWAHFTCLAKLAKKRKIPTIFEHAISDTNGHFSPDPVKKRFLDQVTHIVCVSDALYRSARIVYPDKTRMIVCGIEDDLFKPLSQEARHQIRLENNCGENDVICCFVGLVVRRKGFDMISTIFPEICQEFPGCKLWVIGPKDHAESRHIHNDEVEGYQKLLQPVADQVKFFGNVTDRQNLARLIAATDIFLFPTRQEGFGLAPVEAMACGIPPIIARIPGVTDLANIEGETGLYITPENSNQFKEAITLLIKDKAIRERMGKAARQRIEGDFSWRGHLEQWVLLYNNGE